jgi:hypothetical protein
MRRDDPNMEYKVRCECGKAYRVTDAEAGVQFACVCGLNVDVPPLHKLRAMSEENDESPLNQIRNMVRVGLLPGTSKCACCRDETSRVMSVTIECERENAALGPSKAEMLGCLLVPCFGWFLGLLIWIGMIKIRVSFGDPVTIILPLPVCDECRRGMSDVSDVLDALSRIPEYESLLDYYPSARVTRFI